MSTNSFTDYEQVIEWLFHGIPRSGDKVFKGRAGFEQSRKLMATFGNPQNTYPMLHIAATSGKGSIALLATTLLTSHGFRVGTLMSPHVYDLRERFLIDGKLAAKALVVEIANEVRAKLVRGQFKPSFFETMTLFGFLLHAHSQLDYVVVETGLGGALDTTNTIQRRDKVPLLGSIGLDHTEILGDTLEAIAAQKAGIIKPRVQAFALEQAPGVNQVFKRAAREQHAKLQFTSAADVPPATDQIRRANLQLKPNYQADNLALALAGVEHLAQHDNWQFDAQRSHAALKQLTLPGRLEVIKMGGKTIIFDGAHNQQKLKALIQYLETAYPGVEWGVVFATAQNRQPEPLLKTLRLLGPTLFFTRYNALQSDMRRAARDFSDWPLKPGQAVYNDPRELAAQIKGHKLQHWLITGSFLMFDDLRDALGA